MPKSMATAVPTTTARRGHLALAVDFMYYLMSYRNSDLADRFTGEFGVLKGIHNDPRFTVFENCRLAAQSRHPRALAMLAVAYADPASCERAHRALELTGLADVGERPAGTLSHGEQRQLEVAMVLATEPEVLLLDEPLAGMGADESTRMVELLKRLASGHAILLVEHDMDAVFALADRITVMVNGQVLESGMPAQIRASAAVQQAYLGHEEVPL